MTCFRSERSAGCAETQSDKSAGETLQHSDRDESPGPGDGEAEGGDSEQGGSSETSSDQTKHEDSED